MNIEHLGLIVHPVLDPSIGENTQGPSLIRVPVGSLAYRGALPLLCWS